MGNFTPSTSPYANNFEIVLDPGVKDLVLAFVNKGYLTISSCEGHALYKPRYVDLCFGSIESRDEFMACINKKWLKFLYPVVQLNSVSQEEISGKIIEHTNREEETKGFNYLFLRKHDYYCYLRLHIGAAFYAHPEMNSMSRITNKIFVWCFNLCFRKFLTKHLIKIVNRMPTFV